MWYLILCVVITQQSCITAYKYYSAEKYFIQPTTTKIVTTRQYSAEDYFIQPLQSRTVKAQEYSAEKYFIKPTTTELIETKKYSTKKKYYKKKTTTEVIKTKKYSAKKYYQEPETEIIETQTHSSEELFIKLTTTESIVITSPKTKFDFLKENKIIPEFIQFAPTKLIVNYSQRNVSLGNQIRPIQAKYQPKVYYKKAKRHHYYTLCMFDPDVVIKEEPKLKHWQNWIVGNIPGNDISKGNILTEYIGPKPLPETNYHRYIFFLYKQKEKIIFDEKYTTIRMVAAWRCHFNITVFVAKYKLGNPVAVNFFKSRYDYDMRNRYY